MSSLTLVIDLPFLAGEINDAHRQVTFHAKGILLEAKRAGDALLAAKAKVKHGEFKAWVQAHCRCSYRSAAEYMQVTKLAKSADLRTFEGGLKAFIEAHAKPRLVPAFTPEDAERVLNIHARVERGDGAEKTVAASKLESIAKDLGTTPEALLERSKAMCPDRDKAADQIEKDKINEKVVAAEERMAKLQTQIEAFQKREALILQLMDHTEDERIEMLADALLRIEELEGLR